MCGIIGFLNRSGEPVNEEVVNQFEEQHSRGTKGFGIITINKDTKAYKVSRATEGAKFMFDLHKEESAMMIVHHRFPTSSPNFMGQTHPIMVDNGSLKHKYLVIHNGCISNDDELKKEHEELGFQYTTDITTIDTWKREENKFNDSEALAIEVARFIEKQTDEVGTLGSAAFIAIQIAKDTETVTNIFFGRNETNPLHMSFSRGKLRLSSEGEGDDIKPFTLYSWDLESAKLKKKEMTFKKLAAIVPVSLTPHQMGFTDKKEPICSSFGKPYGRSTYDYPYKERNYDMPWEDKSLDELESIAEFRGEEVNREVEAFFEYLQDKDTATTIGVEETLKEIRLILLTAKQEAIKAHEEAEIEEALEIDQYNKSYNV